MILPQIREDRRVEPGARDAPEREGVRRDLHHDRVDTLVAHAHEPFLQLGRLGRRADAAQRADHPDLVADRSQRGPR